VYCAKCGTKLNDGAKFCSSCGTPVQQYTGAAAQGPGVQGMASQVGRFTGPAAVKKSGRKMPVVIGCIAAILLVLILVFSNLWAIAPKAYYGSLEARNKIISLDKLYQKAVKATEIKPFSKDVSITLTDVAGLGLPEEFLSGLELRAQVDYSKDQSTLYASAKFMNNVLADAIIYMDKDTIGAGLPVLYDRNFIVKKDDISEMLSNLTGMKMDLDFKEAEELRKEMEKEIRVLDKAAERYAKLAFKTIPSKKIKITRGDEPLRIYTWNSGSAKTAMELEKYKTVEINLTDGDLNKIADKLLAKLQKDDEILKIFAKYQILAEKYSAYGNFESGEEQGKENERKKEIVESMKEEIARAREGLIREDAYDEEDDEVAVSITSIVDKKGNIVSRRFVFGGSNTLTINRYHDKDGLNIFEVNVSEGRLGLGSQVANLYIYDGEEEKGIKFTSEYEGNAEFAYRRTDKGKNASGIDYGIYSFSFTDSWGDAYKVVVAADPDGSSKETDVYRLRLQEGRKDILALNIKVSDLKSKSKVKFGKGKAIDLSKTSKEELNEIFGSIEDRIEETAYQLQSLIFGY